MCRLRKFVVIVLLVFLFSGSVLGYTNWNAGEPNDSGGEDCAEIYSYGEWNDIPCGNSHPGLCEYSDGSYGTTSSMSWSDAKSVCESRGGYLTVINDANENNYISNNFGNVWIGYYQADGSSEPAGGWQQIETGSGGSESVADLESYVVDDESNDFVLGRPIRTRFNYTTTRKAQVAFAVDETYSMGGPMNGVKNNIKWFFRQLGDSAEGTVVGSGCGDRWSVDCTDSSHPSGAMNPGEPRDLASGNGLVSDEDELVDAASRLTERTYFEGPDSTVAEALNYGSEASDYNGNIGFYGDEYYGWEPDSPKAVIWVQSGRSGYGSCSSISDFSSGMGQYMQDNGFRFYAIVRGLSGCRDNFEAAASRTGGKVYTLSNNPSNSDWQDILGEISQSVETNINLTAAVDSPVYSDSGYDGRDFVSGDEEYSFNGISTEKGENSFAFDWRPIDYGMIEVKTGDSYITLEEGESSRFNFSGSRQEEVGFVDFKVNETSVLRSDGAVEVNFTVSNVGTAESLERTVWLADGTGPNPNFVSRVISPLGPGSSRSYSMVVDGSNPVFSDPERLYIRVDPSSGSKFWGGVDGLGEGSVLEPDEGNNVVELGYPPKIVGVNPSEGGLGWGETFSPGLRVSHPSGNMFGEFNYTNADDANQYGRSLGISDSSEDVFVSSTGNNYFSDVSEQWYNFSMRLEDVDGATTERDVSYFVDNPGPEIELIQPNDGSFVYDSTVDIRFRVKDENSEYYNRPLQVTVENSSDEMFSDELVPSSTLSYQWEISEADERSYSWSISVEDKKGSKVVRDYSFSRIPGSTTQSEIDFNYSSIVLNEGSNKLVNVNIVNPSSGPRDLTVSLSGVEAEFLDGSDSKSISDVEPKSQRELTVRINPNQSVEGNLTVQTRNNDLGLERNETIEVTALKSPDNSNREVPGIGFVQIIFLSLVSTVLYFGLL